jgi:hypothetical protein
VVGKIVRFERSEISSERKWLQVNIQEFADEIKEDDYETIQGY